MLRSGILGMVVLVACLLLGCTSIGPAKLVPTHEGYNDAVQLTLTRVRTGDKGDTCSET